MRKESENWWNQSLYDFESAKDVFKLKRYSLSVFLCQQSVEKGLKAYFIELKKESPGTTHSLIFLAKSVKLPEKYFKFLRRLMPQFVNTRYPDAAYGLPSELYDNEIALEYLKDSEEVLKWLKKKILKN